MRGGAKPGCAGGAGHVWQPATSEAKKIISQEIQVNDLSKRVDYIRAHTNIATQVNPRHESTRITT